ncbi:DUF4221 family protein [Cyclobacterium sp. 1_MG-2023]|uniref:DUF4221 family protein n=1 Tax=Cyclobacterium sp. 1_MG-2023 TaxID=3062681 RepID=UPI0026E1403A|nr:DUF4221 family protein [Cyclobacterium sp. 1_MG-2023]MDO6438908.1 DUF4221 family protein [Cyclobacterium sp. 1_MG-2023]
MKFSAYFFVFCLILACSSPKTGEDHELLSLEITMDTVVIDPGEEILYLKRRVRVNAISEDKKYLYNVDPLKRSIEQINLNKLTLEKKHHFEREGPNGTEAIWAISLIGEDKLHINNSTNEHVFNWQAEKLESFNITEIGKESEQLEEGYEVHKTISIASDGKQFASLISDHEKKDMSFAIINIEDRTFKKFPVPAIDKARNFEISSNEGGMGSTLSARRYLIKEGGKVLLGTNVSNELYVLDETNDSLSHITFNSQPNPNEKSGTYPSEVGDQSQFDSYFQKIAEDINFMEPVWDEKKQVYYRMSFRSKFDKNKAEELPFLPTSSECYISVLDKDLNLIAEDHFQTIDTSPKIYFAKDGKLWLFENIEDEMGFVRLEINW